MVILIDVPFNGESVVYSFDGSDTEIRADGRGYFIAPYDFEENELEVELTDKDVPGDESYTPKIWLYIYRTN